MNKYIEQQCINMKLNIKLFQNACQMAALKDDNSITKNEKLILKRLNKANNDYIKVLNSILTY